MLQDRAEDVIYNLNILVDDDDRVPLDVIEKCIRHSAYWYGHHHGPAHAPRHAERLELGKTGWELTFGANTFLAEEAIRRCVKLIERAVHEVVVNEAPIDESALRSNMSDAVASAVANYRGDEYTRYSFSDGLMHFGAQAIHVAAFVDTICAEAELHLIA